MVTDTPLVCRNSSKWRHAHIYTGHVHHARSFWSIRWKPRQSDTLYSWFDIFVYFLKNHSLHLCSSRFVCLSVFVIIIEM